MTFSSLPLCSSDQTIAALKRLGAYPGRTKKGSHISFHLQRPGGRIATTVVIMGKRELPKILLRNVLDNLGIPVEDFKKALK